MRKGLDFWPYKVMFWGIKMTTLITNQGTILGSYSLTLLHEPTPKRIYIKWVWHDYKKKLKYQPFFCKVQLNLVFQTINGLPVLSLPVLQLYLNLIQLQTFITVTMNSFVWSTLTKSSTLTFAKTKPENLSSSHVSTTHPETSVTNYQSGLRIITEERRLFTNWSKPEVSQPQYSLE